MSERKTIKRRIVVVVSESGVTSAACQTDNFGNPFADQDNEAVARESFFPEDQAIAYIVEVELPVPVFPKSETVEGKVVS